MKPSLCIGGPMDGKMIEIEKDLPVFRTPVSLNSFDLDKSIKLEIVEYHAVKFRDADGEEFFIYASGNPKTVLKDLIAGYRKPK